MVRPAMRSPIRRSACACRSRGLRELATHGIALNAAGWSRSTSATTDRATARSLDPWMRRAARARRHRRLDGEVVLYAFPRMLGYVFNPVSFWVCHDRGGAVTRGAGGSQQHLRRAAPLPAGRTRRPHVLASGERRSRHARCSTCRRSARCADTTRFRFHFGRRSLACAHRLFRRRPRRRRRCSKRGSRASPRSSRAPPRRGLLWRYRWFTLGVIARIHWQALQPVAQGRAAILPSPRRRRTRRGSTRPPDSLAIALRVQSNLDRTIALRLHAPPDTPARRVDIATAPSHASTPRGDAAPALLVSACRTARSGSPRPTGRAARLRAR